MAYHPPSSHPSRQQFHTSPAPPAAPVGLPHFNGAPPVPHGAVPSGTLPPGTVVRVGEYTVRVERFLSEGGFAHVYLATSDTPIPAGSPSATTQHVLKRIAVPDKAGVEEVGKEVEVMKLLRSHPRIVDFLAASVSELPGKGGYEIYILMEWCAGGGIIDMMNTRLQNRLTESEILKIFSDTVEAVAHMHYQNPPLIHRDLKVENILLSPPQTFKLCDFGSTTTPLTRIPTAMNELKALEAEINQTTTLQYRAPELVDVWSRKGYDEKVDIWALGVLLYKLCYYTTPFEEHGPLAILNVQYKIPPYPAYSNAIKGLIGAMLQERASQRPNIYQVHEQVCRLRGSSIKLENKYANQVSAFPARSKASNPQPSSAYSSIISSGPVVAPPVPNIADSISPMRRGRPSKPAAAAGHSISPTLAQAQAQAHAQAQAQAPVQSHSQATATTIASAGPPSALPDNRMVRTGLASVGGMSSAKPAWEMAGLAATSTSSGLAVPAGFGSGSGSGTGWTSGGGGFGGSTSLPISAASTSGSQRGSPTITTAATATVGQEGFADSFSGSYGSGGGAQVVANASASRPGSQQAGSTTLFSELVPPKQATGGGRTANSPRLTGSGPVSSSRAGSTGSGGDAARSSFSPTPFPALSKSDVEDNSSAFSADFGGLSFAKTSTLPQSFLGNSFAPTPSHNPATPPSTNATFTSSAPRIPAVRQLTGESGPPLPRRPPATSQAPSIPRPPSKPELVSRGSQTSPHLLAGYKSPPLPQSRLYQSSVPEVLAPASGPPLAPVLALQSTSASSASVRAPMKDLLGDDDDFAPSLPPIRSQPLTSTTPAPPAKPFSPTVLPVSSTPSNRLSLAATDASREKFRPVKPRASEVVAPPTTAPRPRPTSAFFASSTPVDSLSLAAKDRFPALEALDTAPPRTKSRPVTEEKMESWQPIVEKEEDSSDDDNTAAPEDFAPRTVGTGVRTSEARRPLPTPPSPAAAAAAATTQALRPSTRSGPPASTHSLPPISRVDSSSSEDGDIDLGPALASIRRFAPQGNANTLPASEDWSPPPTPRPSAAMAPSPTLVAPQPQSFKRQAAISSLVSRYETISSTATAVPKRPPPPLKPAGLRRESSDANTTPTSPNRPRGNSITHWASPKASVNDFQQRFPDSDGLDTHFAAGYTSSSPSAAFAPTSSPNAGATTPTFAAGRDRAPFKPVPPSAPGTPVAARPLPKPPAPVVAAKPGAADAGSGPAVGAREDEEEAFAGVKNMRSRWEGMGRSGSTGTSAPPVRKEWAVI